MQISIATSTEKYTPTYNVDITITSPSSKAPQKISINRPFSEWFDSAGSFIAAPFQTVLATAVPAIGLADPKRVAGAAGAAPSDPTAATDAPNSTSSQAAYSPAVLEMLAAGAGADASESDSAAATGTVGKKAGKRRKTPKAA